MSSLLSDRQEAHSVRPYLQSPGTAVRLTAGAFLPQLMERGEIESRHGRQGERERKGESERSMNMLYKSSPVNVRSADADQPIRVLIYNNLSKLQNAFLII